MLFCKCICLLIVLADQAERSVSIVVFEFGRQHILRTCEQDPFPVQFKEVRTLPHLTEPVVVGGKHLFKAPFEPVRACKEQDLAAAVRRAVSHDAAVCAILFPPHFRIPEIKPAAALRKILCVQYRIALIFLVIHAVSHSKALSLYIAEAAVRLAFPQNAGIHQQMSAVRERYSAPGKASVSVISLIRSQGSRQVLPVQEIFTHGMPPMHGSPFRFIGIILVKHMILTIVV